MFRSPIAIGGLLILGGPLFVSGARGQSTELTLCSDSAVPIPFNFRESEIGAVLVTVNQRKVKTRAVLVQRYKCCTGEGIREASFFRKQFWQLIRKECCVNKHAYRS
jgi:hypothetical protein